METQRDQQIDVSGQATDWEMHELTQLVEGHARRAVDRTEREANEDREERQDGPDRHEGSA